MLAMSETSPQEEARQSYVIRPGRVGDAPAIRELINAYAELGRMLFRSLAEVYGSVRDFLVCEEDGEVVGCLAMHVYWSDLAEIRSLAVREDRQGRGIGAALVEAALADARQLGLGRVFALTLATGFFERLGFERVAMESLPYKVWTDCIHCPKQDQCDEIALVKALV